MCGSALSPETARTYTLAPDEDSVAEARGHVRDALASHADGETLGIVELVVSELVTNSVRHGPGEPITLRLVTEPDGAIAGEVHDRGRGTVVLHDPGLAPAVGGLGLVLVDRLTSAWGVHPGSTHVWFRFDAAA